MASFAPFDANEDEDLFAQHDDENELPPIEYDVPAEWTGLRQELDELTREYVECRRDLFAKTRQVHDTYENIERLRRNIEMFEGPLKESYADLVNKYEIESKIEEQVINVRKLIGKRNALKKILKTKKEERLCPVCCESEVECFIDPCGHTFCQVCVNRSQYRDKRCAVCRNNIKQVRQLFFN